MTIIIKHLIASHGANLQSIKLGLNRFQAAIATHIQLWHLMKRYAQDEFGHTLIRQMCYKLFVSIFCWNVHFHCLLPDLFGRLMLFWKNIYVLGNRKKPWYLRNIFHLQLSVSHPTQALKAFHYLSKHRFWCNKDYNYWAFTGNNIFPLVRVITIVNMRAWMLMQRRRGKKRHLCASKNRRDLFWILMQRTE